MMKLTVTLESFAVVLFMMIAVLAAQAAPLENEVFAGEPVATPLPDDVVQEQPLPEQIDPESLLATLTPDERLALEEISADTGIPIEQLAQELLGPEDTTTYDPQREPAGTPKIIFPDEQPATRGESSNVLILALVALVLLALVALVVWFIRRRGAGNQPEVSRESDSALVANADDSAGIPEAYINDVNGYTDEPVIQLGERPMMVGRVAGNDTDHLDYLVVDKGTVGRRHAVIKFKDFSFWVVDQGSVNGTFVNGERVTGERQLKHGDKVRFHKYDFEFSQPDMDDGFHTVFADPDAAQATIVADAATIAASAQEIAQQIDDAEADVSGDVADDEAPLEQSAGDVESDAGDEQDQDDDEDLGVEINLDTVGAENHPSLVLDSPPAQQAEDFDAEASVFFEDITVGPTLDDPGPVLDSADESMFDEDPQSDLDAKLERANALLDYGDSGAGESSEMETVARENVPKLDDPNDLTLEEFMETDSFDAPATVPPAVPKASSAEEEGDVTLEAFMSTSVFEGGEVSLTNEDPTVSPFEVPDEPIAGMNPGDTVKLPRAPKFDKEDDDDSEDPTVEVGERTS
ncbi:MAG: FHA domain-containing protein [Gammaproteobacteria bacterium]